jgi:hypothetical protein
MDKVLHSMEDFTAAYLDDIIIFSADWQSHMLHLGEVFGSLKRAGLTVKARKCQLGMSECCYLGHVVGKGVVRPQQEKLEAI